MRRIGQSIVAIRLAWSTRQDLLLEALALHHQLRVLARSNRRFRSADRLLWLNLAKRVASLAGRANAGPARDRRPVASRRVLSVVAAP